MRLLIATGNPAKFDRYATLARQLPNVEIVSPAVVHTCFTDRPCFPLRPGYPLQSLQLDGVSGKPLRLLTPEEEAARLAPVAARVRDVVYAARRQYRLHTEEEPSP